MSEYTNREIKTVEATRYSPDSGVIRWSDGWSLIIPAAYRDQIIEGATYLVEAVRFSQVTGVATTYRLKDDSVMLDRWIWHKTDADLETERQAFKDDLTAKRQRELDKRREDWTRREKALPEPLRARLERFREAAGKDEFELKGWGYELVCSELVVMYANTGGEESPTIEAYASENGTSGNQHDFAKAVAKAYLRGEDVSGAIAALSPITGSSDYSKE